MTSQAKLQIREQDCFIAVCTNLFSIHGWLNIQNTEVINMIKRCRARVWGRWFFLPVLFHGNRIFPKMWAGSLWRYSFTASKPSKNTNLKLSKALCANPSLIYHNVCSILPKHCYFSKKKATKSNLSGTRLPLLERNNSVLEVLTILHNIEDLNHVTWSFWDFWMDVFRWFWCTETVKAAKLSGLHNLEKKSVYRRIMLEEKKNSSRCLRVSNWYTKNSFAVKYHFKECTTFSHILN